MKKLLLYSLFLLIPVLSFANQLPNAQGEYMITCFDSGKGGIVPATSGEYPLIYDTSADGKTDDAFWIIKEEQPGKYSLKNSTTNQYIKYAPDRIAEKYIVMVNGLDGDNTLFRLSAATNGSKTYYAIISAADSKQFLNKRSYGAVGTYGGSYSNNELFYFRERNELLSSNGKLYDYLKSFTLNGRELIIDKGEGKYYFPLTLEEMNNNIRQTVQFEGKDNAAYTIKINDSNVSNNLSFTFYSVGANKEFKLEVLKDGVAVTTEKLIFTGLPIVQLYSEGNYLSSEFSPGKIRVTEPEKETTGELFNSEMRYRGASALSYSKKSFAIKLKDENGKGLDQSFFDLRNDNYWILDAMAVDHSRMRNRVCTDLWNDFSADPYHKPMEKKLVNGTRGQFVEVFLDDEYWGLYCMTERVDRKQLKLKKFDDATQTIKGVLYKSDNWSYSVMMGYVPDRGPDPSYGVPNYQNYSEGWDRYEMEYPKLDDGQTIDWEPLYDVVSFAAKSNNTIFKAELEQQIDFPVWLDYYLFIELILATDNHGKNGFYYMYDINEERKLGIAPWDLDGTFGRRWNGSPVYASQDFIEFIIAYEHGENNLYRRLKETNAASYNEVLKKRYDALRSNYFSEESLIKRFSDYKEMFDNSGAATREENRWSGENRITVDFDEELGYLTQWIIDRTNYLNDQYGPPATSIDDVEVSYQVYPNPVTDMLYINNATPGTPVRIYTDNGTCVYVGNLNNTSTTLNFSNYDPGRYYLKIGKKGKVIIKNP